MSHKFLLLFFTYSFSSADFRVLKNSKRGSLQRLSIFEWSEFEKALVEKSTKMNQRGRGQSEREFGDALSSHQDERKRTRQRELAQIGPSQSQIRCKTCLVGAYDVTGEFCEVISIKKIFFDSNLFSLFKIFDTKTVQKFL